MDDASGGGGTTTTTATALVGIGVPSFIIPLMNRFLVFFFVCSTIECCMYSREYSLFLPCRVLSNFSHHGFIGFEDLSINRSAFFFLPLILSREACYRLSLRRL